MGAQFSFWSFFSRFGPMSDFFVSQKVFSRQNSMLLAWLEVISHYQLSSPVHWQKCHIFKIKMNLNVDMSIFWDFSLISMLKRSISFSNFNRTMEPDQSILINVSNTFFFQNVEKLERTWLLQESITNSKDNICSNCQQKFTFDSSIFDVGNTIFF